MKDRIPPQSLNAEMSVLGCEMLDGSCVPLVADVIDPSDFYSDINATIQRAILVCHEMHGGAVDTLLVTSELESKGMLKEIGGPSYILQILETVPYSAHATYYAELVAESSRRRQVITLGEKLVDRAYDVTRDSRQVVEDAHDSAMKMADTLHVKKSAPRLLFDCVTDVIEGYRQGVSPTVWWGITDILKMTGGWARGEMVVMAARPSHAKSMLALQTLQCAANDGIAGMMISEEMTQDMVASRAISTFTKLEAKHWIDSPDELQREQERHFEGKAKILVSPKCFTIDKVETTIERAIKSHGVQIVAVDYAQMIQGVGDNREQQVADVSGRIKRLAEKHEIVILLLAQLNREIEKRDNPKPQISDLRDSGAIEQDADVVLFPYWPWKFDEDYSEPFEYRVHAAKCRNRSGAGDTIKMRIVPSQQRVESWEETTPDFKW